MVAVPLQLQISVGWLSIHCSAEATIWLRYDQSIQKRHGPITLTFFHGELDSIINGVDVLYEPILLCSLDDHKCVIYKPSPQTGWIECCV